MGGVEAITNQEIQAYQNVYGVRFTAWELDVIDMFDNIALEILNKN